MKAKVTKHDGYVVDVSDVGEFVELSICFGGEVKMKMTTDEADEIARSLMDHSQFIRTGG